MKKESGDTFSAQVVLFGRGRTVINDYTAVTSANIADYLPDEKNLSEVYRIFESNGFSTGEHAGISFSITGPARAFEKFLGAEIYKEEDGSLGFISDGRRVGMELSNEMLPDEVKSLVNAIVFTRPPDFGPRDW